MCDALKAENGILAGTEKQMDAWKMEPMTLPEVRRTYRNHLVEDFPWEERKSLGMIEKSLAAGEYECLGLREGSDLLAYAFFVCPAGVPYCLFDYFAVIRGRRGRGIGSLALHALSKNPPRGRDLILLEVEEPEAAADPEEREVREKRLRFYAGNGLLDTGVRAVTYGVPVRILERPLSRPHTAEEAAAASAGVYATILPAEAYRKNVRIRQLSAGADLS